MDKYTKFENENFIGKPEEENEEILTPSPIPEKVNKKYKVEAIFGDLLILVDDAGNGVNTPMTDKYKKLKAGDSIYLPF